MINKLLRFLYKIAPSKKQYVIFVKKIFNDYYEPSFIPEGFFKIKDVISGRPISMFIRSDSMIERQIFWGGLYGSWEKESLKIWAALCPDANTILDIGANTGMFSLLAKAHNQQAQVYAIEPIDINFEVLTKNMEKNKFSIHAIKAALSNVSGTAKMYMIKDRLNYMTSINDNRYLVHPQTPNSSDVIEVEVPTISFKDIEIKYKLPKIDLVKIDVEGHEIPVLENMYQRIKEDRPVILVEVIGDENAVALNNMFIPLGYKFISIDEENQSRVVDKLWDNEHHNFLLCDDKIIRSLQIKGLVS
jgi:FkbM family methyltransferase